MRFKLLTKYREKLEGYEASQMALSRDLTRYLDMGFIKSAEHAKAHRDALTIPIKLAEEIIQDIEKGGLT